MENLEELYKYFNEPITILIINNNSKKVFDRFFNIVYNKIDTKKINIKSRKGLFNKIITTKNKLIRIDFDFNSIQFSSSKSRMREDISDIINSLIENNSRLLCRTDNYLNKNIDIQNIHRYYLIDKFEMVILIDKEEVKLIKHQTKSFIYYNDQDKTFNITKLIRSTKIKNLSKLFK